MLLSLRLQPERIKGNEKRSGLFVDIVFLMATLENDVETLLPKSDSTLFARIEAHSVLKRDYVSTSLVLIKRFGKLRQGDTVHPFPLMKNGWKISLRQAGSTV
jgi:hypothetical protein